jgi:hypothetical protein
MKPLIFNVAFYAVATVTILASGFLWYQDIVRHPWAAAYYGTLLLLLVITGLLRLPERAGSFLIWFFFGSVFVHLFML